MNQNFFYSILLLGIHSLFYSQNFESKKQYLDSLVAKSDTIFLVLTNGINYAQVDVPIYNSEIEKSKFKKNEKALFDTLKDGRKVYKQLPQTYNRIKTVDRKIKKELLQFENSYFKLFSQQSNLNNDKVIGYEKRICFNVDNRVSEKKCGEYFYDFVFYHAKIFDKYSQKYIDYIKFRDENFKRYNVRYSGYSPNFESGAINFKLTKNLQTSGNNPLFFIVDFSETEQNSQRNIITLPYLKNILKEGKVYFLRVETRVEQNKNHLFEEVKYQKYITD